MASARVACDGVAPPPRRGSGPGVGSTALVGLWLVWVLAAVLPSRDPAHIPLWRAVALGCFGYAGLSRAFLIAGPRRHVLLWSVLAASVAAVGVGAYGVVSMLRIASAGGDFEGCILLLGGLIGGHGLAALAYAVLTARSVRQGRASA